MSLGTLPEGGWIPVLVVLHSAMIGLYRASIIIAYH